MSLNVPLGSEKKFDPIRQGTHLARCVNIIELGTTSYTWQGKEVSSNKVRLVFELPEETYEKEDKSLAASMLAVEYSLSMGPKANLRKFVENWLGTDAFEGTQEFELKDLLDRPAIITVVHTKKGDKTYVDIVSAAPLMKSMTCPPASHALKILSYEDFDQAFYERLPEFLRKKMEATPEFEQMKNKAAHENGEMPF